MKLAALVNLSYELRMPLNAILGYSEMLQEEISSLGHHNLLPDLHKIHAAATSLRTLIHDLLELARIEAGSVDFCLETFAVADLVRDVVTTVQPLAQRHTNVLTCHSTEPLGTMHADLSKLRRSLANLLQYACTFTEKGTITLAVTRETLDDRDWLLFRVCDTGRGLSHEQMAYLFQDVIQTDTTTVRQYGGVGVGLALSQRLCHLMGGDLTMTSVLQQGSHYVMRMPVQGVTPLAYMRPVGEAAPGREERKDDAD